MRRGINVLFAVIFIVLVAVAVLYMQFSDGVIASVYKSGRLVHRVNLNNVTESYTLDIDGHNTVLVRNGAICMKEADCPDKRCVNQGEISDSSYPVVCLPNEVIIRIEGEFLYDSITGK